MCVLPADMLVPLGDGEWHVHRALGATEWHNRTPQTRCPYFAPFSRGASSEAACDDVTVTEINQMGLQ